MSSPERTAALVGTCGGAGATRLAVETAAVLALDGRSAAVIDVDFETQGLADHVPGELSPDATAVLADDAAVTDALVELPVEAPGRVRACPARAPFERFARAQTAGAAQELPNLLEAAAEQADHVLVDVGPVATNQAVSAVKAVDTVGLVAPATDRGANAEVRVRGRLADVDASADLIVANRAADGADLDGRADVVVPESAATGVIDAPAVVDLEAPFAPAVAALAESLFGVSLDVEVRSDGLLDGLV